MAKNAALKLFSFGKKRELAPSEAAGNQSVEAVAQKAATDSASAAEHERVLGESLDLFENDVLRVVRSMSDGISEVQDKSVLASERLSEVKGAIHSLGDASERVTTEVSGIAQSAEELTLAANEISDTVGQVSELTSATMQSASESARDIEGLGAAVAEIGTLLTSISEIATRTNLLALNATIEAARAGEAGRGFAVVAQEVKALSVAAAQSVSAIRQRMEALQASSDRAIGGMKRICKEIGEVTPICSTIASAAEEQRQTIEDLADRMGKAQMAVNGINDSVRTINTMTAEAFDISKAAGAQSAIAAGEAQSLGRRVVTILRTMSAANRRKYDRYPIDLALRVMIAGDPVACRSFDLSEGGLLIKPQDKLAMSVGSTYDVEISQVGNVRLRVTNVTQMGTHCAFHELAAEARDGVSKVIATFQREHAPLVERAKEFAGELQAAIEAEIRQGKLSVSSVFDTDYKKIVGSNPAQFTTEYLERFDAILPAIMERTVKIDPQMVYCLPIDRNGYIPVHNQKYSQKPKADDVGWNIANCRNRRIYDDRTALLAARLMRPSLVQTYNRDMGNGTLIPMKEVDVPLVIMGRHWGGIRMAYSL